LQPFNKTDDRMKLANFTTLSSQQEQLDVLRCRGDVLANRYEVDDAIFLLYSLGDFYVELRYDAFKNTLLAVDAFRNLDRLEPYLPYLDAELA
jgi:hypothetical protein